MASIDKEMIRAAIKDQFGIISRNKSRHIDVDKWVLWTKLVLGEMLEVYRALYQDPDDRDNDPTFLPYLINLAISAERIISCPFQENQLEKRLIEYNLKLDIVQITRFDEIRNGKGWDRQTFLANTAYTGLLKSFPEFQKGSEWTVQALYYPELPHQPNAAFLQYNKCKAIVTGINKWEDPWVQCEVLGKTSKITLNIRKDWLM